MSPTADGLPLIIETPRLVNEVGDDRDNVQPGDPLLLIVENDLAFARLLLEAAREKGFKGLVTSLGAAALAMTRDYKPDAITLDICLPDIDGWRVMDRLKNDITTRHIPVCVISTEEAYDRAASYGAAARPDQAVPESRDARAVARHHPRLHRPAGQGPARRRRRTRAVATQIVRVDRRRRVPGHDGAERTAMRWRSSASKRVDCLVLDASVARHDGRRIPPAAFAATADHRRLPVILYSDQPPTGRRPTPARALAPSVAFRQVCSPERLLDQTAFFLHSPVDKLPEAKRRMLEQLYQTDQVLAGKKVLIVDDDIRNIFALTSILEWRNMVIVSAETGRDAIKILQTEPDVDIVLMDIMMPEMDGLDTMRVIRKLPQFNTLPIIAVTAKAMKGDREKCIEAGAWDYLSKPVDTEQLLSVLRVWLHR